MFKNKDNSFLIKIVLILIIIYLLYLLSALWGGVLNKIVAIIYPFLLGFILAYAFHPFLKFLQDKKIPKTIGIIIICLIILGFTAFILINIVPVFTTQLKDLTKGIVQFVNEMGAKFGFDSSGFEKSFNNGINNLMKELPSKSVDIIGYSFGVATDLIIAFVTFIYMLVYMDKIRVKARNILMTRKERTYKLIRDIDHNMNSYFKGLLANIIIMFIEYTLVYWLIGHPNFLLLGLIAALTPLLPYFGGVIMNIVAIITAAVISPTLLIFTIIVGIVCPQIDGYIIYPKVYGKTNNVPTLLTIFAVFTGGVLAGTIGILFALPLTIVLLTIYRNYDQEISKQINKIKNKEKKEPSEEN